MSYDLTCIICPRGCALHAEEKDGELFVSGNVCPKGEKYAAEEIKHPTRTVTSIIRVSNRRETMLSVKTLTPVAKEHIFDLMREIRGTVATAPVFAGDVIFESRYGVSVVATKDVE